MDELADPVHDLRLAALEVADEVPAEGVAVGGVLGLQVLGAVLADDLDPGLGERRPCPRADTYFVAATTVTAGPTSALIASYRARIVSADVGDHPLAPGAAVVAAVGEEELRVAARAEIGAVDVLDAGGPERPLGRASRGRAGRRWTTSSPKRSRNGAATSSPTS